MLKKKKKRKAIWAQYLKQQIGRMVLSFPLTRKEGREGGKERERERKLSLFSVIVNFTQTKNALWIIQF